MGHVDSADDTGTARRYVCNVTVGSDGDLRECTGVERDLRENARPIILCRSRIVEATERRIRALIQIDDEAEVGGRRSGSGRVGHKGKIRVRVNTNRIG